MATPPPPFLAAKPPPVPVPSAERLAALYSFTRAQREANPDGYRRNVQWWGDVLQATLKTGYAGALDGAGRDVLVLTVDGELLERFANASGATPKGLGGVVDTLANGPSPTLVPLQRFLTSPTPIDASPSITSRLAAAGWSALGRLSPFGGGEATEDALWKAAKGSSFVDKAVVKTAAQKFSKYIDAHPPVLYSESLYTRTSFHKEFAAEVGSPAPLGKRDIDVLLVWLSRDVGSVVVDGDVVKILSSGQVAADHPITEADRGAVAVTGALAQIEAQISAVEAEGSQCQEKAKKQLRLGQRATAASYLRSKKHLDEVLAKRVAAGEQLRGVLRALDQAKGDAEIMSAYEASTAALSSALSDPRLSPERIAATTDALADALADQKEIDDAVQLGGRLAAGAAGVDVDDDDELEKELAALVLEEKEEQRKAAEAEAKRKVEEAAAEEQRKVAAAAAEAEEKKKAVAAAEEKRKAAEKAAATAAAAPAQPAKTWEEAHADAQQREREEKERAAAERLAREERLVAAE
ncbi:putative protein [Vanrija pseudolonga]|uniref:Purtative protein n=1 Tax=Vanrija pseudolonga TaxID=143232 RepID=A0AAF0YIJ3_9TREE|nr:purtative protein [Vanrija pseudolonga]